jgi:hypothetical protein
MCDQANSNITVPCPVLQLGVAATQLMNLNECTSCSVNKYGSKQALFQARHPDNCNLYFTNPYPPLSIIYSPMQSSNVSWSSYTSARNPMYTYSTHKVDSGGPFLRHNMSMYYPPLCPISKEATI